MEGALNISEVIVAHTWQILSTQAQDGDEHFASDDTFTQFESNAEP